MNRAMSPNPGTKPSRNRILTLIGLVFLLLTGAAGAMASETEDTFEGVVRGIVAEPTRFGETYQVLEIQILSGTQHRGTVVTAEAGELMTGTRLAFQEGDRVVLYHMEEVDEWVVIDAVRRPALYLLAAIFAVMVVLIGGFQGLFSLLGLGVSFFILLYYLLPQLLAGANPISVSITAATGMLVGTLYLAHGFNRKTTVAIVSTAASLTFTGFLGSYFVDYALLSGLSEDVIFLEASLDGFELDFRGLLLAGIIIGGLGVLDDITISQTAVVFALRRANSSFGFHELYKRAMSVGKDHIASLVNTLVMAYAGVALPLLLLFTSFEVPFAFVINREIIAVEVVRTLVGSLGLVTAVPITTALAAHIALRSPVEEGGSQGSTHDHHHHHHH